MGQGEPSRLRIVAAIATNGEKARQEFIDMVALIICDNFFSRAELEVPRFDAKGPLSAVAVPQER